MKHILALTLALAASPAAADPYEQTLRQQYAELQRQYVAASTAAAQAARAGYRDAAMIYYQRAQIIEQREWELNKLGLEQMRQSR